MQHDSVGIEMSISTARAFDAEPGEGAYTVGTVGVKPESGCTLKTAHRRVINNDNDIRFL